MNHDIPVAQVRLHLYESLEFLFFYAFVYFLADLVLFEIPERCGRFIWWSETSAGETGSAHVGLSSVLVHFILNAPLNESLHIFSCL